MTSEERRLARYERRQARRRANREKRSQDVGALEDVFSFRNMFLDGLKSCNGVRWKRSTQNFELHLFSGTARRCRQVCDRVWKPGKYVSFTLRERGKTRRIDAPHITDRQVVKTLNNRVLRPLYHPTMIYDNGACQPGKGLHWQFDRLKQHLRWHFRRYGRTGAVLLIDLKGYFPNALHSNVYARHKRLILDSGLRELADLVLANTPGAPQGRGLPLGVEVSQEEMAAYPSAVDHWIKCQLGIHCAGHYADDYYVIWHDRDELAKLGHKIVARFEAAGIPVNRRKCKLIPLTKPFKFCKAKFRLTETGGIVVNGCRDGMKRARRKLKLFRREMSAGLRPVDSVAQYMNSQEAYYKTFNDHGRLLRLRRIHHALFEKEDTNK